MNLHEEYKRLKERLRRNRLNAGAVLVPGPQTLWMHLETDKIYQVVQMVKGAGNLHGDVLVLYRDPLTLDTYVRSLTEWHMKFVSMDKLNRKRTFHMHGYPIWLEEHECIYEKDGKPQKSLSIHYGNTTMGMMGPESLKLFYRMFKEQKDTNPETRNKAEAVSAEVEQVFAHPENWTEFKDKVEPGEFLDHELTSKSIQAMQDAPEVPVNVDEINGISPGAGIIE